ncbi:MAG: deoxyribonuclease IV [Candidatus Latescibacteria bacterium]|nr:deoxyribonuclease IV [Candidatus Latescibacterota bacterium]NIO00985.1 deoxyribonuclease IV [Candidatus Latescibacterota bacterium]NIO27384.1 deoxyribonuclease IV [Candidatus Latescibacterota bacterium]NIO54906.1 deoxyribonuclease IV [Candidatus Latescibacterota bacterium]NIT00995.1 deoxyribonuclease IV [Candidatus Latescibacterota bacterium]
MLFGAHVSIQGGIHKAPEQAAALGCECFQIFSRSPRGGPAKILTREIIREFRAACDRHEQKAWYIHAPYYVNLASHNPRIRNASIRAVREELERGRAIGATAVMTHLGSARETPKTDGLRRAMESVHIVLQRYRGKTKLLAEIAAGSGGIIGDSFEELAQMVRHTGGRCGICFDTQHAFASGYDLRTTDTVKETLDAFDAIIGLEHLELSHCSDSLTTLGSRKDRHGYIGEGEIGKRGFRAILAEPRFRMINFVLETKLEDVPQDLRILKRIRRSLGC